jgi:hypothetical protein
VARERAIGEDKVKAADAKAVIAALLFKSQVEADAQKGLDPANSQLRAALDATSPPGPVVSLRVCPSAPARDINTGVPTDGTTVARRNGDSGPIRNPVVELSQGSGVDIGPTTEQLLAKADAEIAYWRAYYADCVARKICK